MRKWACAAAAAAGLTGAGGIILAAAAAHGVPDQRLQTAANFLMLHAAAPLGGTLLIFGWALVTLTALIVMRQSRDGKFDQNIDD